ncbi:MAG: class I tRNA ligase family protein [Candidatus Moranbacteria bacterium]|nr:class I tRNA ligase family protein [Candidatus Moranbacteria bacterium]
MEKYNSRKIEKKWQKKWEESGIYKNYKKDKKFYALDMFPYTSGEGLHVGHPRGYIATDVVSRFKMLQGASVLHPMGWDAFGLPTENYAIEHKIHPRIVTEKNISVFKKQLQMFGFTYDWDREINTTDPGYYKWTQWIFLKMFEKGLAYESNEPINWCPSCKTGLALEDLEKGLCERCGTQVVQKKMRQWVLRMTNYADRLLYDLDSEDLDWEEQILEQQRNWIGRSEGTEFKMPVVIASEAKQSRTEESNSEIAASPSAPRNDIYIEVYTTRLDTAFGMTYAVVAPEHPIVASLLKIKNQKSKIKNIEEIRNYIIRSQNKTELERMEAKEKTGMEIKGIKVINPFTNEEIPLFVADYVLGHYGTGAVMAVPAHDERDWEFARKYNLPIKQSIVPNYREYETTIKTLNALREIYRAAEKKDLRFWLLGGLACAFYAGIIYREHNDLDLITENENDRIKMFQLLENLGFKKIKEKKISENLINFVYQRGEIEVDIGPNQGEFGLAGDFEEDIKYLGEYQSRVLSKRFVKSFKEYQLKTRDEKKDQIDVEYLSGKVLIDDEVLVNSEKYSGLTSQKAREEMAKWLEKQRIGKKKINYKMRDWVFSRQRYWGEPIPIIHCEKCGAVGVPEKELPVTLPDVESYEPTGTGESPLANIKDWVNTTCPKCGGPGKRETNTMPQWAGSSWYYLRYIDSKNEKELVGKKEEKKWMPVDLYVGGIEHATRHLLYARFWHKFLYDIGVVSTKEPFKKLVHVGLIGGEDGRKMSKRWGNVVSPNDVIEQFGADSIRLYEMFMGPFTQGISWSTAGVSGMRRFLEKVWKSQNRIMNYESGIKNNVENLLHKTIKKITEDIENFRFNTALSSMMIYINQLEKQKKISMIHYSQFLILLSPFAPHIAEELWEKLGHKESIFRQSWPKHNPQLIKDEEIDLVIQVNGKVRDTVKVSADISEDEAKKLAFENQKAKTFTKEKVIKKVIFVKGKLINIVVS